MTKLDVLDEFEEILVAERYTLDGADVAGFPPTTAQLERVQPVWRRFPGWKCATTAARAWSDLPQAARTYLEWVEREAGVPIARVSVGAGREAEVSRT